ncbi:MAG TPA: NADH:flavin oxidoreductase/NADH oxidase [Pseudorhodoplanes sp.]|jgi:NADPH2 dehydrogenase|nr:NADH:flavin oxidoreductase/NADH oxidase [Pseudorhodoplanes sp.]
MTSALFTPVRLAGLELKNRIVVAPMCQYSAQDGCATDWHMTHLGMLANSGAALMVVEATGVERIGRITHGCHGLYSDANEDAIQRVVNHCRRIGKARIGIQLAHAGRKASSQLPWQGGKGLRPNEDPWETIAPSAIPYGDDWPAPREATRDDLDRVREAFVSSARRALRVGFDSIELHLAHGYLLHTFLSPVSNRREDEFGGSIDNRMRFPLEVVRAVRAVVPKTTPLGVRISASDWVEGGWTLEDSVVLARALKAEGVDYVCCSSGGIRADTRTPHDANDNVALAQKIRNETGIATRAVGHIVDPRVADGIIANGQADMVALARGFLDDPHWAWHAAKALGAEIERPDQYLRAGPQFWPPARSQ